MTKATTQEKRRLHQRIAPRDGTRTWWGKLFYFVAFPVAFFTSTSLIVGSIGWYFSQGWLFVVTGLVLIVGTIWSAIKFFTARRIKRENHIQNAALPPHLKDKFQKAYPHLSLENADIAEQGLREFFLASLQCKSKFLAMPSKAVDLLWHEFILHTKAYEAWCKAGLGYFLHHTPAVVLGKSAKKNDGLRRIWFWACAREGIDPRKPSGLPNLFMIDALLSIPDGFHYKPDCGLGQRRATEQQGMGVDAHCGTSFSSGGYSGSSSDFGGAESSADSDGGSSSSDGGGGGDGGGCGGGGGD